MGWVGKGKENEFKFPDFDETSTHYAEKDVKKVKMFFVHYFLCKLIKQFPVK